MDEELISRDDVGKRIHVEPCFFALFARAHTQLTICHTHARARVCARVHRACTSSLRECRRMLRLVEIAGPIVRDKGRRFAHLETREISFATLKYSCERCSKGDDM